MPRVTKGGDEEEHTRRGYTAVDGGCMPGFCNGQLEGVAQPLAALLHPSSARRAAEGDERDAVRTRGLADEVGLACTRWATQKDA